MASKKMTIKRTLQNAEWEYNEETQELSLEVKTLYDGDHIGYTHITLNRTYAFSLARFLIRVFFRMSMKKRKITKTPEPTVGETPEF